MDSQEIAEPPGFLIRSPEPERGLRVRGATMLILSKSAPVVAALLGSLCLSWSSKTVEEPKPAAEHLYRMAWDDRVDGELQGVIHECYCLLGHANDKISGVFIGPVGGTERDAVLTGEVHGGGALVTIQQHESGYVCAYQLQRSDHQVFLGTWRDTKGRRGEVKLVRVE